jgi:hypothetical protein
VAAPIISAAPINVALFTIFQPNAASGVAWLQSWFTLGVAHVYLFINAVEANTTSSAARPPPVLSPADRSRVEDLVAAFPGRVTLVLWPFSWYSGSVDTIALDEEGRNSTTLRHLASIAAYTTAIYRWGHLYSHMGMSAA